MRKQLLILGRATLLLSILTASLIMAPVSAANTVEDFYNNNNINFFSAGSTSQCQAGSKPIGQGISVSGNKDYAGNQIITDEDMEDIKRFQPMYEKASEETRIPWQVFAAIHMRESELADFNPKNDGGSQGIYQDYGFLYNNGEPYTEGKVSDEEFLEQTVNAGLHLLDKLTVSDFTIDQVESGDPDAIKDIFLRYNGSTEAYGDQAEALFGPGTPRYEGSPYVMNRADKERDPTVEPTKSNGTWGQYKYDNAGKLGYPANGDYGAYVVYSALAGVPTTGGPLKCLAHSFGASANGWAADAMQVYYQDDSEWANEKFGDGTASFINDNGDKVIMDTIIYCGCGPTSVAMAISTLNNDPSITPVTMSNFFMSNGYLNAGCGTRFDSANVQEGPFGLVGEEFGVEFIELGTDLSKAAEAVKRGSFVFLSSFGTNQGGIYGFGGPGGHIMLIRAVTDSGNFLFADPNKEWGDEAMNDKTNNEEGFAPSEFESGIQLMYEIRKK